MKRKCPEYELQKAFCKYLNLKHSNLLFSSDTIANVDMLQILPQDLMKQLNSWKVI